MSTSSLSKVSTGMVSGAAISFVGVHLHGTRAGGGDEPAALLIEVEQAEVTGNDAVARPGDVDPGHAPRPRRCAGSDGAGRQTPRGRRGGPPAVPLKLAGAIPGMTRLLRLVMDRAYRPGLCKEGYDDLA
jgi:hypothetical protein